MRDRTVEDSVDDLCGRLESFVEAGSFDCFLAFDEGGITGHPDHRQATTVARIVAHELTKVRDQEGETGNAESNSAGSVGKPVIDQAGPEEPDSPLLVWVGRLWLFLPQPQTDWQGITQCLPFL